MSRKAILAALVAVGVGGAAVRAWLNAQDCETVKAILADLETSGQDAVVLDYVAAAVPPLCDPGFRPGCSELPSGNICRLSEGRGEGAGLEYGPGLGGTQTCKVSDGRSIPCIAEGDPRRYRPDTSDERLSEVAREISARVARKDVD